MSGFQINHNNLENAVQAKRGSLDARMSIGSVEQRLMAWGGYLEKHKQQRLKLKDHAGLYELGKLARAQGMTERQIDARLKMGRVEYLRPRPIKDRGGIEWYG